MALKKLEEILGAFGLTKASYWQFRAQGTDLPEPVEKRRRKTGPGLEYLYDEDAVKAAIEAHRNRIEENRRLRAAKAKASRTPSSRGPGRPSTKDRIRELLATGPKTRKELRDTLNIATESGSYFRFTKVFQEMIREGEVTEKTDGFHATLYALKDQEAEDRTL